MTTTIYVKHESGAMHAYDGRRLAKLRSECLAGRGMREITALLLGGYVGFLADSGEVEDFDALPEYLTQTTK